MGKRIAVLGSTGSIGKSVLEVASLNPELLEVVALSCHSNIEKLQEQAEKFPNAVLSVAREDKAQKLKKKLQRKFFVGEKGVIQLIQQTKIDLVVCAISGHQGIYSMLEALDCRVPVAIANKEPLVVAGKIVSKIIQQKNIPVYPIDSEHNAIFQCFSQEKNSIEKIILTASGGPFLHTKKEDFSNITLSDALQHPKWSMGKKNTIDSATTMNKALEIIEAKWLFDLDLNQIEVLVHPQSIVHGVVQYKDGTSLAQLCLPDMRVAISYCLGQKKRIASGVESLDLLKQERLDFFPLSEQKFPLVALMRESFALGEGLPSAMNGLNEIFVELFLSEKISFAEMLGGFTEWMIRIKELLPSARCPLFLKTVKNLDDALESNHWGMETAKMIVDKKNFL